MKGLSQECFSCLYKKRKKKRKTNKEKPPLWIVQFVINRKPQGFLVYPMQYMLGRHSNGKDSHQQ